MVVFFQILVHTFPWPHDVFIRVKEKWLGEYWLTVSWRVKGLKELCDTPYWGKSLCYSNIILTPCIVTKMQTFNDALERLRTSIFSQVDEIELNRSVVLLWCFFLLWVSCCDLRFVTPKEAGLQLSSVLVRNNMFPSGLGGVELHIHSLLSCVCTVLVALPL